MDIQLLLVLYNYSFRELYNFYRYILIVHVISNGIAQLLKISMSVTMVLYNLVVGGLRDESNWNAGRSVSRLSQRHARSARRNKGSCHILAFVRFQRMQPLQKRPR